MAGPVTERDKELMAMPSIASQLPVKFNGGQTWTKVEGICKGCGHVLPDDLVHGIICSQTRTMSSMEAVGMCHSCNLITRFYYRLHDDMRVTGPRDGVWKTWHSAKDAWPKKIFSRLLRLFYK